MIVIPSALSLRTTSKSLRTSSSESAAVGSSMTSTDASVDTAFAISMTCFCATLSSPTSMPRLMESSSPRRIRSTFSMPLPRRMKPRRALSLPSVRFSATVRSFTTFSSWYRTLMPPDMASRTLRGSKGFPPRRISPRLFAMAPVRILMNVDLPAPFSPTMQWTVLRPMSKLTSSRA